MAPLWEPLKIDAFRTLYIALSIAMLAGWMNSVACSWLMTTLDGSALMLGLVQGSYTLPGLFFALAGGVLADRVDRRRFLMSMCLVLTLIGLDLSLLTALGWIGPWGLLAHTLAMGIVFALQGPAMMAVIQDMVRRDLLPQALTLNSISLNVGRAVGPALAGGLIGALGVAAALVCNAASSAMMAVMFARTPRPHMRQAPREKFIEALWNGLRFAVTERRFRGILLRFMLFLSCASSLLALMPLVAKETLGGGPGVFGTLITWVGVGSVVGAMSRGRASSRLSPNAHALISAAIGAAAFGGMAFARDLVEASAASFFYGLAWTNATITFQVAAQMSVPAAMRGRGISLFMMTFGTGMMLGGVIWGIVADVYSIKVAMLGAGIGTALFSVATWTLTLNLPPSAEDDLEPMDVAP
ncbi:MAG: MFS transporter [Rhodospirillaceae bacterium]|nr:MFS transporter [Rhodospirillaceae bacterium]